MLDNCMKIQHKGSDTYSGISDAVVVSKVEEQQSLVTIHHMHYSESVWLSIRE